MEPALFAVFGVVTLFALVAACFACHYATSALIEVKAMQNSTHNIQLVPATPEQAGYFDPSDDQQFAKEMARREQAQFRDMGSLEDDDEPLTSI